MITNTALQHYMNNNSSKSNMDMSSLLISALYERTLQERLLAQEVTPSYQQQQSSVIYHLPSNTTSIHQGSLPTSVTLDGKLYALLPIQDQGISDTVENNHRPNLIEQYRDDLNSRNRTNSNSSSNNNNNAPRSPAVAASYIIPSAVTRPSSRRKGKDPRGTKHRPTIHVPPMAFVAIREPCVNDVLMGRGGRINKHVGNVQLRNIVASRQEEYLSSSTGKLDKAYIAADIVASIRLQYHPPGRFLEQNPVDQTWYEVGDERAIRKVLQALREHAPEFRSTSAAPNKTNTPPPTTKTPSSISATVSQQTEV